MRDPKERLRDILEAIAPIEQYAKAIKGPLEHLLARLEQHP